MHSTPCTDQTSTALQLINYMKKLLQFDMLPLLHGAMAVADTTHIGILQAIPLKSTSYINKLR